MNDNRLPGKPDIVLPKYHTVIFIHGCFWHGHKGCKFYTIPKTNTDFWTAKVARNQERDQDVWRRLEAMGWFVIVVWECQLKKKVFYNTVANVIEQINQNGGLYIARKNQRRRIKEDYLAYRRSLKNKETALREEIESI